MPNKDKTPNYYSLIREQDELYDRVEPYVYLDGIISKVREDAPDDIKADFRRMKEMNLEIQLAKLYV